MRAYGHHFSDRPIETAGALSEPKFQFVMNLKTANALGIAIPPLLLNQADKLIG